METEVKLSFKDKESLNKVTLTESFRKHCVSFDPVSMLLENYYLDTSDMLILKRGGSVRKRIVTGVDNYCEYTVKYRGGADDGIHQRYEWNARLEGGFTIEGFKSALDSDGDPVEFLSVVFEDITEDELLVLCFNSFNRTTYELKFNDSMIEACFDSGTIYNSDKTESDEICELELEIIEGRIEDLIELTGLIRSENECEPLDRSKFMRTLAMAGKG